MEQGKIDKEGEIIEESLVLLETAECDTLPVPGMVSERRGYNPARYKIHLQDLLTAFTESFAH